MEIILDLKNVDLLKSGFSLSCGYVVVMTGNRGSRIQMKLHRLIMERKLGRKLGSKEYVDHINRDKLDYSEDNLRLVTPSENTRNSKISCNNKSGFRGVHLERKRWRSDIRIDGIMTYLGAYDTPEEASKAYLDRYYEEYNEYPPEI